MVNALWVETRSSIPPINFADALAGVHVNRSIKEGLNEIIAVKQIKAENTRIDRMVEIDRHIKIFFGEAPEIPVRKMNCRLKFNREISKILNRSRSNGFLEWLRGELIA